VHENDVENQLKTVLVRNEVLQRMKEERNILRTIKRRKGNWIGHILRRNCHLKHTVEGNTERRDRSDGKKKEEDVSNYRMTLGKRQDTGNLRRTGFGRGFGPLVRQTRE
jgi:hypothetical protein